MIHPFPKIFTVDNVLSLYVKMSTCTTSCDTLAGLPNLKLIITMYYNIMILIYDLVDYIYIYIYIIAD